MRSVLIAVLLAVATPSLAEVSPGPYPDTVTSRNGELIWYVGVLPLTGHRWRDMDRICASLPVPQVSGWRAPWMAELETLFVTVERNNGLRVWNELYLADESVMAPAIEPFAYGSRNHEQVNLLSRNLWTYEGQATTLARADREGGMHQVQWFSRWTNPFIARRSSIRHRPGDSLIGGADRLLCVAETS